jgi:RNA polymerase sigma-70 factor (ECF subfamily)
MASGFEAEFEELWGHTSGKISAYMFCACGNRADTDDLVQECYLRALRGWGQFDGRGNRQAWLFAIARRTRADWFRQKQREHVVADLNDVSEPSDGLKKPNTDRIDAVWQAVNNLGDEQSEVVHLRFAAGLSYIEIAGALGIAVGTVRSRLHRALRTIRQQIGGTEQ